jgi:cell division protein FtsZ
MATAIKIIGVGGGGCNVIRSMLQGLDPGHRVPRKYQAGCQYVACNSDIRSLDSVPGDIMSVQIGEHLTRGFGCGGDVRVGARAAEEGVYLLRRVLKDAEVVFVVAGLGGGCGTGAAPKVAEAARMSNPAALIIGVVSLPFTFEGKRRDQIAQGGLTQLKGAVDNCIVVEADRILQYSSTSATTMHAMGILNGAVAEPIKAIVSMLNGEQYDQGEGQFVDLADVKLVMREKGEALLAVGKGKSVYEATQAAIVNRLSESRIRDAQAALFHSTAATIGDFNDAINLVASQMAPEALIFPALDSWEPLGAFPAEVTVTLIATGIRA